MAGSPFALDVAPGQIHAGSCRLSGPGMHSVQLGREMQLSVHLADSFGNAIAAPGALEAHDVQVRNADGSGTLIVSWICGGVCPYLGKWMQKFEYSSI